MAIYKEVIKFESGPRPQILLPQGYTEPIKVFSLDCNATIFNRFRVVTPNEVLLFLDPNSRLRYFFHEFFPKRIALYPIPEIPTSQENINHYFGYGYFAMDSQNKVVRITWKPN